MFHLLYTSHAAAPFSESELIDLLKRSRTFNLKNHVTGMLLYLEGKFMQVLEGDKKIVLSLYDKIKRDPTHTRVTTVIEGDSPTRVFKDWSMGFKQLSFEQFSKTTGFHDIDKFFTQEQDNSNAHLLMVFLQLFYKKNIVDYSDIEIGN